MKTIEIKLPCGTIMKVKLNNGLNMIRDSQYVFMLIDGEVVDECINFIATKEVADKVDHE